MHFHLHNRRRYLTGRKQTGVAIITALLIVTIAATVSITISTQLQLDVRRTGNMIALDQTDINASLIEKFVQDTIFTDPKYFDPLKEQLSKQGKSDAYIYPVENGTIEGQIADLNSCINLNSLLKPDSTPDTITEDRVNRLFSNNNIPRSMTAAITDWIDTDLNTTRSPDGAEDGHYLNLEQPYHTANQELSSITELRLIKGAENQQATPTYTPYNNILALAEAFKKGSNNGPSLCAFKTNSSAPATINVNTASRDVLLSLAPTMTTAIVEDIIACRGVKGNEMKDVDDFTDCSSGTVGKIVTDTTHLRATSEYFLLKTTVSVGDAKKTTYSIIFRDSTSGKTEIISRTQRTL
jgi:general secretion pathway protein K